MPNDRRNLRRSLFLLAAGQGGYFSARQAKSTGYSYQAQAYHVSAGNWMRIDRGIFRLTEWIPSVGDDLMRWTLWSNGRAVVARETALSVFGVGEFESAKIEMTVPPGFRLRSAAVHLATAELPLFDVEDRVGYRVTTLLRSLIDVAATGADDDQLGRAILQALELDPFGLGQLRDRAEAIDVRAALRIERALLTVDRH